MHCTNGSFLFLITMLSCCWSEDLVTRMELQPDFIHISPVLAAPHCRPLRPRVEFKILLTISKLVVPYYPTRGLYFRRLDLPLVPKARWKQSFDLSRSSPVETPGRSHPFFLVRHGRLLSSVCRRRRGSVPVCSQCLTTWNEQTCSTIMIIIVKTLCPDGII